MASCNVKHCCLQRSQQCHASMHEAVALRIMCPEGWWTGPSRCTRHIQDTMTEFVLLLFVHITKPNKVPVCTGEVEKVQFAVHACHPEGCMWNACVEGQDVNGNDKTSPIHRRHAHKLLACTTNAGVLASEHATVKQARGWQLLRGVCPREWMFLCRPDLYAVIKHVLSHDNPKLSTNLCPKQNSMLSLDMGQNSKAKVSRMKFADQTARQVNRCSRFVTFILQSSPKAKHGLLLTVRTQHNIKQLTWLGTPAVVPR